MRKVVLSGVGVKCAVGRNFAQFRRALREGRNGLSPVEWIPISRQSAVAAQLKDLPLTTPGRLRRIARTAIAEALADARVTPTLAAHTGLYFATVAGDALTAERLSEQIASSTVATRAIRAALLTFPSSAVCDRLARDFQLGGLRDVNTNACASGNIALARALHAIRIGRIDIAVVCGADQMKPITYYGADRSNILGPSIKPFHRDRNGTVLGDGAGAIVVESLDHAMRRGVHIRAVVDGFGISCSEDPHEIIPQMDGRGVARCIRAALADAGIPFEKIAYINAHATGTTNIEISECAGIRGAFGPLVDEIPVNATKSFTGHLSSASAVVEIIATVDAIESNFLHETIGLDIPDPALPLNYVPLGGMRADVGSAISISMGAGGVNTAVVLSSARSIEDQAAASRIHVAVKEDELPVHLTAAAVVSETPPQLATETPPAHQPLQETYWAPLADLKQLSGGQPNAHYNNAALLALAAVTRLVQGAGLDASQLESDRLALVVGTMLGGTATWSEILARAYAANPRHITPAMALSHGAHLGATLISRRFGLIGPTVTLTGGLTAGLSALSYGLDLIRLGQIDRAIICSMEISDAATQRADTLLRNGGSKEPPMLNNAGVALLIETDMARRSRNHANGVTIVAAEERFAPVGAGRFMRGLCGEALCAALKTAGTDKTVLRIDGSAHCRWYPPGARSEFSKIGSHADLAILDASLAPNFGDCGAAAPLAAVAVAADHLRNSTRYDGQNDVAVTAIAAGGAAACVVLRACSDGRPG